MRCRSCGSYYTQHAMLCPHCHPAHEAVVALRQAQGIAPQPGDTLTIDGVRYNVLAANTAPTGEPIACIEPVDHSAAPEWVYADGCKEVAA